MGIKTFGGALFYLVIVYIVSFVSSIFIKYVIFNKLDYGFGNIIGIGGVILLFLLMVLISFISDEHNFVCGTTESPKKKR